MSLQVGDAQAQDIPALAAIYDHQVLHGFGTFEEVPPGPDAFRAKWESVRGHGLPFIVVRDGAEIAGYAYASPFRPRSGYRFTIEDSIYVRHDMHGRGVGSLLMSRLLPACEATGARQVIAVIGDTLNAGSIGVHTKFGFVHAGTIPGAGFKLGRWVDLVFMHKALNGGTETLPTGPGAWISG